MDNSPPRALYPYAERVHNAIIAVFRDNLHLFKGLGAEGVNKDGEEVDGFGEVIDEPILEELFHQDKEFFQNMAAPGSESDEEEDDVDAQNIN